jgi:hypothetical protein
MLIVKSRWGNRSLARSDAACCSAKGTRYYYDVGVCVGLPVQIRPFNCTQEYITCSTAVPDTVLRVTMYYKLQTGISF